MLPIKQIALIIVLLCIAGAVIYYSMMDAPSVAECMKIKELASSVNASQSAEAELESADLKDAFIECISSVATIKAQKDLCERLDEQDKNPCVIRAQSTRRQSPWILNEKRERADVGFTGSVMDDPALRCATSALDKIAVRYSKDYMGNWSIYYSYEAFPNNCSQILQGANESICADARLSEKDRTDCAFMMKIAKSPNSKDACSEDTSIGSCRYIYAMARNDPAACNETPYYSGACYLALAIEKNDSSLCGLSGASESCWLYFALKGSDTSFCSDIKDEADRHSCMALILAEKGS